MRVTVVSRDGCHLCETVIAALRSISLERGLDIAVVDISTDAELHHRYALRIPVVLVEGREIFEARDIENPESARERLERLFRP